LKYIAMSAFDVSSYPEADQRRALNHMARLAEASERYDDMATLTKKLVMWAHSHQQDLTEEERNLLSVAYKNVIGARRASWRILCEPTDENKFSSIVDSFKAKVEQELETICAECLDLLENYLVSADGSNEESTNEAQVFYLKMIGDYYRYRAESAPPSAGHDHKSAEFYERAFRVAERELEPTHPTRLGLALNFSVCYYEILKKPTEACELAKRAFDLAISELDKLRDDQYKDSTLIMQLLRDNLTLWLSDSAQDENLEVADFE